MQAEERQKRIEEHLMQNEFASLEDLSSVVEVSISTVRRDLGALEDKGSVRRTHGGARFILLKAAEPGFTARETPQLNEKEAIAGACAELVGPNQTVIIDAGTTCFHVARYLEAKTPHVITNSLPVAHLFSSAQTMEVVVSGGLIYPRLGVLVGPLAVQSFAQVHADVAIMSCGGISADGIFNSHGLLIEIQRAMMHAASRIILCVDHTKFGRQSISRLCSLEEVDVLVTDQTPPRDMLSALKDADVEIVTTIAAGRQPTPATSKISHPPSEEQEASNSTAPKTSYGSESDIDRFVD